MGFNWAFKGLKYFLVIKCTSLYSYVILKSVNAQIHSTLGLFQEATGVTSDKVTGEGATSDE